MAVFQLPTSTTDSFYVFEIELDGVLFRLEFKFNERDEAWYLNILDVNDNQLRSGLRVVTDWALLIRWQDIETRPAGEMIAVAQGDIARPALLTELGEQVILTYLDADEVAAASAAA